MARNEVFEPVGKLSVPVPEGTESGDFVLVFDEIPAVALTDEGDGGNADNHATVALNPKWVFEHPVNAAGAAIDIGDRVFLDGTDLNDDNVNGTFYGWALEAVANGATTTIRVLLADGPLA
jgi:hypothetical protein